MQVTLTSKRQVTFPVEVCEAIGISKGARLELIPGKEKGEWIIRPFRIHENRLAPLKNKIRKGSDSFDIHLFRNSPKNYAALRD